MADQPVPAVEHVAERQQTTWSLHKFLVALKLHISHAAGGSILLLPFALSQVGVPLFLGFLVFHAYSTRTFQRIVHLVERSLEKERLENKNGNPDNTKSKLADLVIGCLKFIFALDVLCCIAFYFLLIENIWMKLLLPYDFQTEWDIETPVSVAVSLLLLSGVVIFGASGLNTAFPAQVQNGDRPTPNQEGYYYVSAVAICCGLPSSNAEETMRARDFQTVRNLQLVFFTLLFAMIISAPTIIGHTLLLFPMGEIGFVQALYANAIIMFCFKSYYVITPVNDERRDQRNDSQVEPDRKWILIILFGVFSLFAVFAGRGIDGDVSIVFITGYRHHLAGYVLIVLCLFYIFFAMFLRFVMYCKHIQRLVSFLSSRNEVNDADMFWTVTLLSILGSLLLKSLFKDTLLIVLFTGSIVNNVLRNVVPPIAYFRSNMTKTKCEKLQAIIHLVFHSAVFIAAIYLLLSRPIHDNDDNSNPA